MMLSPSKPQLTAGRPCVCRATAIVWCLLALAARGAGLLPEESAWRVWLEPRFTRAAASGPVPGAQRTDFAGGIAGEEGPVVFSRSQWDSLGIAWDDFFTKARANAAPELAALKPKFVRDRRTKVIAYATLASEQPIMASAVLAPKFLALFADTLGPKVLVAVPNRHTAFVFPRLASNYQDFASTVIEAYRATTYPVSLEVLEFGPEGIRAVGVYEEP
jgi:hypothetical protein